MVDGFAYARLLRFGWIDAAKAVEGGDTKPLIDLLRSEKPLEPLARALIADLLDRGALRAKTDRRKKSMFETTSAQRFESAKKDVERYQAGDLVSMKKAFEVVQRKGLVKPDAHGRYDLFAVLGAAQPHLPRRMSRADAIAQVAQEQGLDENALANFVNKGRTGRRKAKRSP